MTKNICFNIILEKQIVRFLPNVVHSTIFIGLNCVFLDPAFYWRRRFLGFLWTDFDKLCVFWRGHSITKTSILTAYLSNVVFRDFFLKKQCKEQYFHCVEFLTFRPGVLLMSAIIRLHVDGCWQTFCVLKSLFYD